MRFPVRVAVAFGVALMLAGYAQAAKTVHRSSRVHHAGDSQDVPGYRAYVGNPAADGNNANSMRGSNSAVENASGRTNCC